MWTVCSNHEFRLEKYSHSLICLFMRFQKYLYGLGLQKNRLFSLGNRFFVVTVSVFFEKIYL